MNVVLQAAAAPGHALRTRQVIYQANLHILALAMISFGGIALLCRLFFIQRPFGSELLPPPGSALLGILAGLTLAAAARQAPRLFRPVAALLAGLCLYTLLHAALAGLAAPLPAWLGAIPRPRLALAAAGLLLSAVLHLCQRGGTARQLGRALGLGMALMGLLSQLALWFPALDTLRMGARQASTAFGIGNLFLVWTGAALALWPAALARPLDRRTVAVGALAILATSLGWLLLSYQTIQFIGERGESLLSRVEDSSRQNVEGRMRLMQRMAERWQVLGALPDKAFWEQEARSYLRDIPSLAFIAVLDAEGRPHRLEDRGHGEAQGLRARSADPAWRASVQQASRPRLDPLADAYSAQAAGALIALPLRLSQHPGWLLVAGLDINSLFAPLEKELDGFALRVEGDQGLIYDSGTLPGAPQSNLVEERRLSVLGLPWRLQVYYLDSPRKLFAAGNLPALALLTGLIVTLVLMINQSLGALVLERSQRLETSLDEQARTQALNQRIMAHSQDVLCSIDAGGRFTQLSPSCEKLFGYRPEELIGRSHLEHMLPEDRPQAHAAALAAMAGRPASHVRSRYLHPDGQTRHVLWSASWSPQDQSLFAVAHDVTALVRQVALVEEQSQVLRMISTNRPLAEPLEAICRMVEAQTPGAMCSVLLTDASARHVLLGAAPSLPEAFSRAIDGSAVGPRAGSCGTAVFRREPVVVEDIREDPLWQDYRELAAQHGLRACWSTPLMSRDGHVLGTFAIYHRQPYRPGDAQRQLLATTAPLAAIAIERHRDQRRLEASEQRFRSLYTFNPNPVFSLDLDGRLLGMNAAGMRLSGYSEAEIAGQPWSAVVVTEDSQRVAAHFAAAVQGQPQHYEARIRDRWNMQLTLEVTQLPMRVDGELVGMFCIAQDISERKSSEQKLRLLQRSLASSYNGVVISDAQAPDMPIIYANPAFERITGYTREEALGRNCRFLQGEIREPRKLDEIRLGLAQARDVHVVLRNVRKNGSAFWNDLYISPIFDDKGQLTHFVGVQNDISEQRRYEEELSYNASHDLLTGLPNRALLEDRLRLACQLGARTTRHLAVMFVDLDGFKPINDAFGHACGDQMLIEVARRMQAQVRPGDTVARMGGDEFIVLLQDLAQADDVLPVAQRLIEAIARPYRIDGVDLHATASVGIALGEGEIREPMSLVQQADLAMFKAKQEGRNNYQWYSSDLNQKVSERLSLRNELQKAMNRRDFELYYQPQIDGASGRVVGMEALLRWRHPERGLISPADFIPVAEDSGHIVALGLWVLDTACVHAAALAAQGLRGLVVGVNISAVQFQRDNLVDSVRDALERHGLAPDRLELEITESTLMQSSERVLATLQELNALGVRIALDDFGTGFSGLSYLKRLPIHTLKIDRAFVQDVDTDGHDAAISQAIISMAHHLHLRVIAEGVETEAQLKFLKDRGCDEFQGYHFARPMPFEELKAFLLERATAQPSA